MTLRLAFMGTPDFAVPTFEAIAEAGHEIAAVYTRPPAPGGRGLKLRPSPVEEAAAARALPIRTPRSFRDAEVQRDFAALALDAAVVTAYGLILPQAALDAPRHGCLNLHASLLPRWRGAAPIHRAVLAGDRETGVGVMRMEAALDTGPVGLEQRVPIGPDQTTGELHDVLARAAARLAVEALARLEAGTLAFRPQPDSGVCYAAKIVGEEARIDWANAPERVHDHVRGLSPWPGAFFELNRGGKPERVRLLRTTLAPDGSGAPGTLLADGAIACLSGAVRPLLVQRAGRAPAPWDEFLRGARLPPGTVFS